MDAFIQSVSEEQIFSKNLGTICKF